jgi:hypothetical protein
MRMMSDTLDKPLDIYGIEGHELEPVDDTFDGTKYYRQDDVQILLIALLEDLTGGKYDVEIKL